MKKTSDRRGVSWLQVAVICTAIVVSSAASATAAKLITTKQIKNSAITTAKIKNKAVTTAKLKNNAVTSAKIKNGAIQQKHLGKGLSVQGQQGPQGPAGPAGRDGVQNIVVRRGNRATKAPNGVVAHAVSCAAGETAIGGGGEWLEVGTDNISIFGEAVHSSAVVGANTLPPDGGTADGWRVRSKNTYSNDLDFVGYVICTKP